MKIILEGRKADYLGWSRSGTLMLSNGDEYTFTPLQDDRGNYYMDLRLSEVATLRYVRGVAWMNGKRLDEDQLNTLADSGDGHGRRFFNTFRVAAALKMLPNLASEPKAVAFFRNHDDLLFLRSFRLLDPKPPQQKSPPGQTGRLKWDHDFDDVWLGNNHYNLRNRNLARLCIKYLVEKRALDPSSARHFADEIEPAVRAKVPCHPQATSERRIHYYFNGRIQPLFRELIGNVERKGRYYLKVH